MDLSEPPLSHLTSPQQKMHENGSPAFPSQGGGNLLKEIRRRVCFVNCRVLSHVEMVSEFFWLELRWHQTPSSLIKHWNIPPELLCCLSSGLHSPAARDNEHCEEGSCRSFVLTAATATSLVLRSPLRARSQKKGESW